MDGLNKHDVCDQDIAEMLGRQGMSDEKKYISFHHSLFAKTYEEQANEQGYTFGDNAELVQEIGFGLMAAHIHGLITDKECDKIFYRFQTKILAKWVKERKDG